MKTRFGVDYENVLLRLMPCTPVRDRGDLMLRHDVDHNLDIALSMARIERKHGVCSTYYLLTPAWGNANYLGEWTLTGFRFSDAALVGIRELVEAGHEVGYHNNLITVSRQSSIPPLVLLSRIVGAFADLGIAPIGTASHGDIEARRDGYVNYDFLRCYDLPDLGIEHEAYFLKEQRGDDYLSDSGGNLNGKSEPRWSDWDAALGALRRPAQVLIHPWWWQW